MARPTERGVLRAPLGEVLTTAMLRALVPGGLEGAAVYPLHHVELEDVDFTGAKWLDDGPWPKGIRGPASKLSRCRFGGSIASNAIFRGSYEWCTFDGLRARSSEIDARLDDCTFVHCGLGRARVALRARGCTFREVDFGGARFEDGALERCTFEDCDFTRTALSRCAFRSCVFVRPRVDAASVIACTFSDTDDHPWVEAHALSLMTGVQRLRGLKQRTRSYTLELTLADPAQWGPHEKLTPVVVALDDDLAPALVAGLRARIDEVRRDHLARLPLAIHGAGQRLGHVTPEGVDASLRSFLDTLARA